MREKKMKKWTQYANRVSQSIRVSCPAFSIPAYSINPRGWVVKLEITVL